MIAPNRLFAILTLATFVLVLACDVQQDRREAENLALRINSQIGSDDFMSIYRESGSSFKRVGDETRFISSMQQLRKENGNLQRSNEVAYQTGIDSAAGRTYILVFNLEFERGRIGERVTFTRDENGQMKLWDLRFDPMP